MILSLSGGMAALTELAGLGSSRKTAARVDTRVSPENARRPVHISYSTDPNEQISDLASKFSPRTCAGDIYEAVPIAAPQSVRSAVKIAVTSAADILKRLARPKSRLLTRPSRPT